MKRRVFTFKDGAIAFLIAFLLSQLFIFAGQLIISAFLAMMEYTQAEMNDFFRSSIGNLVGQLSQLAAFVVIFVYYIKKTTLSDDCKTEKTQPKLHILLVVLGIIVMFTLSYYINYATLFFNLLDFPTLRIGYNIGSNKNYFISIISLAIIPAIGEELMFRGVMYNANSKKSKLIGILVSSASFALFHFNITQLLYPFLFGLILSTSYAITKNLFVPISIHFVNNFINLTMQHFANSSSIVLSKHIILLSIIGIIVFIAIMSFLVFLLIKKGKDDENNFTIEEKPKQSQPFTRVQSAIQFMKSEGFVTTFCYALMIAFYVGLTLL